MPTPLPLTVVALPLWVSVLDAAERLLMRAVHHCAKVSLDEAALLDSRLADDMFSLAQQVQVLCDSLQGAAALVVGQGEDSFAGRVFNRGSQDLLGPPDTRLAQALARVRQARARCLTATEVSGLTPATIVVARPGHVRRFEAPAFVWHYVVPNAYFHLSMVHALLRRAGVPVGKADFEGPPAYSLDPDV
jgi:hypothetical protein